MDHEPRSEVPAGIEGFRWRVVRGGALFGAAMVSAIGCTSGCDGHAPAGMLPAGRACTQIGCQDGLLVQVLPANGWPHGEYRFDIHYEDVRAVCTGLLPLPSCDRRALVCDATEPTIVESGCALEPAAHAFGDIVFSSTPAEVAVVVTHDGKKVGAGRWNPIYRTSQPNGPGCEPVCTTAAVELVLRF